MHEDRVESPRVVTTPRKALPAGAFHVFRLIDLKEGPDGKGKDIHNQREAAASPAQAGIHASQRRHVAGAGRQGAGFLVCGTRGSHAEETKVPRKAAGTCPIRVEFE